LFCLTTSTFNSVLLMVIADGANCRDDFRLERVNDVDGFLGVTGKLSDQLRHRIAGGKWLVKFTKRVGLSALRPLFVHRNIGTESCCR
jgi:hypothetical protein